MSNILVLTWERWINPESCTPEREITLADLKEKQGRGNTLSGKPLPLPLPAQRHLLPFLWLPRRLPLVSTGLPVYLFNIVWVNMNDLTLKDFVISPTVIPAPHCTSKCPLAAPMSGPHCNEYIVFVKRVEFVKQIIHPCRISFIYNTFLAFRVPTFLYRNCNERAAYKWRDHH